MSTESPVLFGLQELIKSMCSAIRSQRMTDQSGTGQKEEE